MSEKIRLGGMALANGVLVHGPNAWACAVRTADGALRVESDLKRFRAARVGRPFLRGPARVAEIFALLPEVRRRVPEARLPFERPVVLAAMIGGAVFTHVVRGSGRLGPAAKELIAGFWIWQCKSKEEAIEWMKRCPNPHNEEADVEIRQIFEAEDFGAEFTPELREQEERIRTQTEQLAKGNKR